MPKADPALSINEVHYISAALFAPPSTASVISTIIFTSSCSLCRSNLVSDIFFIHVIKFVNFREVYNLNGRTLPTVSPSQLELLGNVQFIYTISNSFNKNFVGNYLIQSAYSKLF